MTEIVTEILIAIEEIDVQLHRRDGRQSGTSVILATKEIFLHVISMSAALAATLETDHLQQGQRSQTLPFLAPVHHIVAAGLGEAEVAETLEGEEGLFTVMTGTGITIQETGRQIARTGRAADRPYGGIVIFETSEILTGEIVTTAGFQGSTTLTSDLQALRNLGHELWTPTAGPGRLTHGTCQERLPDQPHTLHITHPRRTG